MRSALLVSLVAVLLAGTATSAHADEAHAGKTPADKAPADKAGAGWSEGGWYFGEGFGSTRVSGEASRYFRGDLFALRAFLGRRINRWAIDAYVEAALLEGVGPLGDMGSYSSGTYGISARYLFPVTDHLTPYLRGGLSRMIVSGNTVWGEGDRTDRYAGRAVDYGLGVQLQGKVRALGLLYWPLFFAKWGPKVSASLHLDVTNRFARLHHPTGPTLDTTTRTWTVGFSIGGGF